VLLFIKSLFHSALLCSKPYYKIDREVKKKQHAWKMPFVAEYPNLIGKLSVKNQLKTENRFMKWF